ncbi:hypothetical protein [Paenibacillus flagellatus]|uniref:hypothetical protein n=1 Tax=Paenibacillus flagellatus TaxID=2211139 RepID=UPI0011B7BBEB|nr:hypothetical protein [Paenibacillus flagellatus]
MAKSSRSQYRSGTNATPDCRRFCTNVCNRLFLFGRQQCIADCLRCGRIAVGGIRGASVKSSPRKTCKCGCGKCR